MKLNGIKKLALAAALLGGAALVSAPALAQWHHPRVGIGLSFGVPWPGYYYPPAYPPAYYYPPVVVQQPAPPVYVERPDVQQAAPAQSADWFYCGSSQSYYPYVRECPGGWQRVPAQPAR